MKQKTYFNDPIPLNSMYKMSCNSCRSDVVIIVERYPHGPDGLHACPVCGSKDQDYRRSDYERQA